jgi:6-phosphogluconate dehydrogenase
MVSAGKPVDDVIGELIPNLKSGDTIIDGGNSFYKDSVRRAKELETKGIDFLDVGVSGGPAGARNGACIMVGGKREVFEKFENLFKDLATEEGYSYMGSSGAGHFVKMVHNGIEYGMMQSIAEGFTILKNSSFNLDLKKIADLYNHKSVVESRLVGWLEKAFKESGSELEGISGTAKQSGEGLWTAETAKEMNIPAPVIQASVDFRKESESHPSFAGKVLSAMRNQFGGHEVKEESTK